MKTKKLTFHADPSHGWLEVDFADLDALHITAKVSRYSYHSGSRAFLEEDCDAGLYLEAAKAQGWVVNITENYTNNDSFVRRFPRFEGV
jgi:hypothetical protein